MSMSELERRCARAICIAIGDDPDREGDERVTAYDSAARAVLAEAGVAELVEVLQLVADDYQTTYAARRAPTASRAGWLRLMRCLLK